MGIPMWISLVLAILSVVGVSSDGHAPSTCQTGLSECSRKFDSSSHEKQSLAAYLECLTPIDCSSSDKDAADYKKMVDEVTWSLNNCESDESLK
ncbi:hypothetical protein ElyMa_003155100 [Elysia marginata]|uniref:Uncharacterized protein n=1 Tax=Elysia marginata TaxID=1093978 RepID=A0AAV4IZH0_9GAST|nr:hypothetical protein ElyMa_003155100 [Elysia marginata]